MANPFHKMIADTNARRETDAKRFLESDRDLCMICWAYGEDKRSMYLSCGYAVNEAVPEALDTFGVGHDYVGRGYFLNLCKSCRASMLGHMRAFADERRALRNVPKDHDGHVYEENPEANIPMRIDGAIVMLTKEQWDALKNKPKPTHDR